MATSLVNIQIEVDEHQSSVAEKYISAAADNHRAKSRLINLVSALAKRSNGKISVWVDSTTNTTKATATLTLDTVVEDQTATVGGVVFTFKDSPSGELQVDVGTSDTVSATNLAAAINAHSTLKDLVTATSAAAVVTVTAALPGRHGKAIYLAGSAQVTASAAALAGATTAQSSALRTHSYGK